MKINPIGILLKNDSLDVARLMIEALSENNVTNKLSHVTEGIETMAFLKQHRQFSDEKPPDLILSGLSMPKMDEREVLAKIKQDKQFKRIPVVILTTSQADEDIIKSYDLNANCYMTKAVNLDQFPEVIRSIKTFWLNIEQYSGS